MKGPSWWTDISVDVNNGCGIDYMHTVLLSLVSLASHFGSTKHFHQSFSVSNLFDIAEKASGFNQT